MISYLPATPADAPSLVDLIHSCFAELAALTPPSGAIGETPANIVGLLAKGRVVKAVSDGLLVGCVAVEPRPEKLPKHLYVGRLGVLPAWRGHGIARSLLAAADDYAREAGVMALQLNVRLVLTGNIRLFEGAGYRIVGQGSHPGFSAPTYHIMRKDLAFLA
jgi:ribosomal protein S18 acetylase RimI-like enzyme